MSGELTISITGDSNNSNLILSSNNGSVVENGSLESKGPDPVITPSIPETKMKTLGKIQSWRSVGGNLENTNNLDVSVPLSKYALTSLKPFKIEDLSYDNVTVTKFSGIVNETHFFQLVGINSFGNYFGGLIGHLTGPTIFKFNRFTGEYVNHITLSYPEKAWDSSGNYTSISSVLTADGGTLNIRGPITFGNNDVNSIFVSSNSGNLVYKLNTDLSLVWVFQTPHFEFTPLVTSIGPVNGELIEKTKRTSYTLNEVIAPPKKESSNKNILVVSSGSTISYVGSPTDAIARFQRHFGGAYVFGIEDLGNSAKLAWEFNTTPYKLIEGDTIPDECFAAGESEVWIWDKLKNGYEFTDGSSVTGTPQSAGTWRVIANYLDSSAISIPDSSNNLRGPTPELIGTVTFSPGTTFDMSGTYTIENITRISDGSNISVTKDVSGYFISYLPVPKKLYKGTNYTLTSSEATGLNYTGGSIYSTGCYDSDTDIIYLGSANGYSLPLQDSIKFTNANLTSYIDPSSGIDTSVNYITPSILRTSPITPLDLTTAHSWRDDIMNVYREFKTEGAHLWNSGLNMYYQNNAAHSDVSNGELAFKYGKMANKLYYDNEKAKRSILSTLSPRAKRNFMDAILGIRVSDGQLIWANCALGDDQRDNSVHDGINYGSNMTKLYVESGTNQDVMQCLLNKTENKKRLLVFHKSCMVVYDISGFETSSSRFTSSQQNDKNATHGISGDMILPSHHILESEFNVHGQFSGCCVDGDRVFFNNWAQFGINAKAGDQFILPILPINGNPILKGDGGGGSAGYTNYITCMDIELDISNQQQIKWILKEHNKIGRMDEGYEQIKNYGLHKSGKLQGYGGILLKGDSLGGIDIIDKNSGNVINTIPTIGGTWAGAPVVNYTYYTISSVSTFPGGPPPGYGPAKFMEMYTLNGI